MPKSSTDDVTFFERLALFLPPEWRFIATNGFGIVIGAGIALTIWPLALPLPPSVCEPAGMWPPELCTLRGYFPIGTVAALIFVPILGDWLRKYNKKVGSERFSFPFLSLIVSYFAVLLAHRL